MSYRACILQRFIPDSSRPKKRGFVLLMATHLNGDWRQGRQIQHFCRPGCCSSPTESLAKTQYIFKKMLQLLRPGKLCRANWLEWRRPFSIVGLLAFVHHILPSAFPKAFPPRHDVAEEQSQQSPNPPPKAPPPSYSTSSRAAKKGALKIRAKPLARI